MKRGSKGILPVGGDLRRIPFHKESMGEMPMLRHSESFPNTLLAITGCKSSTLNGKYNPQPLSKCGSRDEFL